MISVVALVVVASSIKVETFSTPGGNAFTVTRTGVPKPGARVWTCKDPTFGEANALGALKPGEHNPHSKVTAVGASFTDPAGKDNGHTSYTGISLQFYEGQQVSITLEADKMSVTFRAYNCANGRSNVGGSVANGSKNISFTFQPKEGLDKVSMEATSNSQAAQYSSWSWTVGWTFRPGQAQANPVKADLTAADAQDIQGAVGLMRGTTTFSDATKLVTQGEPLKGVAADGVSLVVLRAPTTVAGTAEFDLAGAGGALYPIYGERPLKTAGTAVLRVPTMPMKGGKFAAVALYRPPSYFGKGSQPKKILFSVRIKPNDSQAYGPSTKLAIDLVRPPVVLVHGTYDNPKFCYQDHEEQDNASMNLGPQLEALGYRVFYLDWESTNGNADPSDFETNHLTVWDGPPIGRKSKPGGIKEALETLRAEHLAVTQADVVCHSQGGMIVRTYCRGYSFKVNMAPNHPHFTDPSKCANCWYHRANNFYMGDIHRLITISSTHRGSHVLNLTASMAKYPDEGVKKAMEKLATDFFLNAVNRFVSGIFTGGVKDQIPGSKRQQQMGPTPVPSHAIACVCTDDDMRTVRPDSASQALKVSVPGMGNYWNKLFKIYVGTTDNVRLFAFKEIAQIAKYDGIKDLDKEVQEYERRLAKWESHGLGMEPLLNTRIFTTIDPQARQDFNAVVNQIRRIVFQRDRNDCTVAMTSSFGGLKPPYTFVAEHVLHGWAPRYRNVQMRVIQVLTDNGSLLDPDGFRGYNGAKSNASTFAMTIKPENVATALPEDPPIARADPKPGKVSPVQAAKEAQVDPIVGSWTWAFARSGEPVANGSVTFNADGTMTWSGGSNGTWKRENNVIRLNWSGKTQDTLKLSSDGKVMSGVNNNGWKVRATKQGRT